MRVFCAECEGEFDPVEYRPVNGDDLAFCSSQCEDEWNATEELAEIYYLSRYGGAEVF